MRRLSARAREIMSGNSGETLMESLVSLLIFALAMIVISMLILTALRISGSSLEAAEVSQGFANDAIFENYGGGSLKRTLSLTEPSLNGIDVDISVYVTGDGIYSAFYPEGTP